MIYQGITTNEVDESTEIARVQVEYLGNTVDNLVILEPKGFHTKLPVGTHGLVIEISKNQLFFLHYENKLRPKDLEDGEEATGNFEKNSIIKYKNDGSVVVNDGENNAVQYQAMDTFIQSFVTLVNAELVKIDAAVPAYTTTPIVVDTVPSKITKFKVE